jgi:hypothetical protein
MREQRVTVGVRTIDGCGRDPRFFFFFEGAGEVPASYGYTILTVRVHYFPTVTALLGGGFLFCERVRRER